MTGPLFVVSKVHQSVVGAHSQVGSTNANVDNVLDGLAGVTLPLTTPDLLGEFLHVLEDLVDTLNNALSVDLHWPILGIAESDVVNGALLGEVDLVAIEHVITKFLQLGLLSQFHEKLQCLIGDEVLGEVEDGLGLVGLVVESARELFKSLWILRESILEDDASTKLLMV